MKTGALEAIVFNKSGNIVPKHYVQQHLHMHFEFFPKHVKRKSSPQETFLLPQYKILAVKNIFQASESIFWGRVGKM